MDNNENLENSAINKVEEISKDGESVEITKTTTPKKTRSVKKSVTRKKPSKQDKLKAKQLKKQQKIQEKKQRAKIKEERKIELAKIKKEKKAEKLKAKLRHKEERQRKIAEFKQHLAELKDQKQKRKEMLKNETKAQRQKRIAMEKKARFEAREQERERVATLKAQKAEYKQQLKNQKAKQRAENKKRKASRGIGGWLAAVISLGCSVLVLGALLTLSLTNVINMGEPTVSSATAERSFYELVGYVDNMETNLAKLKVSSDTEEQQKLLSDVRVEANLAVASMEELPLNDEYKFYTVKYVNQIGDYAKYLNNQLIDGQTLTSSDYENLDSLYNINKTIKTSLSTLSGKLGEHYDFRTLAENNESDVIVEQFKELENNAVDYPTMIYDGPFADNVSKKEAKAISGDKISELDAIEKFKSTFADFNLNEPMVMGEVKADTIECYNVVSKDKNGDEYYSQISKKCGKLVMFNHYSNCEKTEFDIDKCVEIASTFLNKVGLKDMKAVWINENNNVAHINFAYTVDGVICYNDLVKVNVCQEKGMVLAMDAHLYYLNHQDRKVEKPTATQTQATQKVKDKIDVETIRLAIIPKGNNGEVLTYEVMGKSGEDTFYIYVDAKTLKEVKIFKVVRTTEGTLLI